MARPTPKPLHAPAPEPSDPPEGQTPLRFAHPFFTSTPVALRAPVPGVGSRMADFIQAHLGPIPAPRSTAPMALADIIGAPGTKEIKDLGTIRFHATGDTGLTSVSGNKQDAVAADMALDFHPGAGGGNPALFLHLGDVIYGHTKDNLYRDEFYRPYKDYPGKILAVAGNHDGETFPDTDTTPLGAFLKNFCAPTAVVPPIASGAGIFRQTMTQPGVYWMLDAPFVQIIGLYSNIGEGPGFLTGANGDDSQTKWLTKRLTAIAAERHAGTRKALIFAVHHPAYSNGGHAGSPALLTAFDAAGNASGVMPDAVLSGHAHNYQRHTRHINFKGKPMDIPFVVAGCGGHGSQAVEEAFGQVIGDRTYEKSRKGYGYLLVSVTPQRIVIDMWAVPSSRNAPFDSVAVDLSNNRLV
jgi:Calcineurin-like phosphoesterase